MISWAEYLTRGTLSSPHAIYHMAIREHFQGQLDATGRYFPPTYDADGFIHATKDPTFLIDIGNHFYKSSVGDWILIKIDTSKLGGSKLVYEAPAPVGSTTAYSHDESSVTFPHIYGPITAECIVAMYPIERSLDDGAFVSIQWNRSS